MRMLAKSLLASLAFALGIGLADPASAQEPAAPVQLAARSVEGRAFDLRQLRGRVVLLMYWSTDCAVCRDKMHELRLNAAGWRGKPFELVLVSVDRRLQDLQDYERILEWTVPASLRFTQLWTGSPGYSDNLGRPAQLPMAYVIDPQGRVVERFAGRIPAEAWDRIADLLP